MPAPVGLSWAMTPRAADAVWAYSPPKVQPPGTLQFKARLRELEQNFAARGRQDWYAALMKRWEGIAEHAANGSGAIIDPPPHHSRQDGDG
ncbi:hypothetical protein ABZV14_37045 [Streptosporangium canum]|uniref:hypothetical protein n=1 Tax=Streptosporangium canum TaxID=324952 RepID=UPI0033A936C1